MKEIIETTQLEYDKSTFLIDLVKHSNRRLYIEINQIIHSGDDVDQSIKINPSVLTELIKVLQKYQKKIPDRKRQVSEATKNEIQQYYFKNIPLADLALQFKLSQNTIEMVLRNRGIQIISNKIPKSRYWRKRKRR